MHKLLGNGKNIKACKILKLFFENFKIFEYIQIFKKN